MKTTPLLRAVVLGGGVALLANPVWAGGGAHSYDRNQAGQKMHDSGTQVSNLEKEKKRKSSRLCRIKDSSRAGSTA